MTENIAQPRKDDVVLGNQATPPADGAVLGGLEGVKRRLTSEVEQYKMAALWEAVKYGREGVDLVIPYLKHESIALHKAAYQLLRHQIAEPRIKQAIREYNPYRFFECIGTLEGHPDSAVASIAISADGKTSVTGGAFHDKTVRVWDLPSQQLIHVFKKHANRVHSVVISPDGRTYISAGDDIKVGNLRTGREIFTLQNVSGAKSIAPSLDWQILYSGHWDGNIIAWNLQTGEKIYTVEAHRGSIECLAISPDGQTLFNGGASQIKRWNLPKLREIDSIDPHLHSGTSLIISPNGRILVSGGEGIIQIWDLQSKREINTIKAHLGYVVSLAFTPDEQILVSSGNSKNDKIKFWDWETKENICTLTGNGIGYNVALSADGQTLVSGSNKIEIWKI